MTVLFLINSEEHGILDTENLTVTIKGKTNHLAPGSVLKPGDSLVFRGKEFTVLDYMPAFHDMNSDRIYQTIKAHDAAYMINMAGIRSGSNVIESGVGNGTFTAHLLWFLTDRGRLTSVDISDKSLNSAKRTLSQYFDLKNWNSVIGDIREFNTEEQYDTAFLDIPDPWNAVSSMQKIIKPGGSLVVYSPNYNQIEKAVTEMNKNSFHLIETTELLKRNILVRDGKTRPDQKMIGHTAFIAIAKRKSGFSHRD